MERGMATPGLTSEWNVPTRSPARYLTAPISVMASAFGEPPVVSRSTAQNVTRCSGVPTSSPVRTASIRHLPPPGPARERSSLLEHAFDGQAGGAQIPASARAWPARPRPEIPVQRQGPQADGNGFDGGPHPTLVSDLFEDHRTKDPAPTHGQGGRDRRAPRECPPTAPEGLHAHRLTLEPETRIC